MQWYSKSLSVANRKWYQNPSPLIIFYTSTRCSKSNKADRIFSLSWCGDLIILFCRFDDTFKFSQQFFLSEYGFLSIFELLARCSLQSAFLLILL